MKYLKEYLESGKLYKVTSSDIYDSIIRTNDKYKQLDIFSKNEKENIIQLFGSKKPIKEFIDTTMVFRFFPDGEKGWTSLTMDEFLKFNFCGMDIFYCKCMYILLKLKDDYFILADIDNNDTHYKCDSLEGLTNCIKEIILK